MSLVKDCALRIKGRCKKLGHLCCLQPGADLYSCPELVGAKKTPTRRAGRKK